MKNLSYFVYLLCVCFAMSSCKPTQKIVYNMGTIVPQTENRKDVVISIQSFSDGRSESEMHLAQLQAKDVVRKLNDKQTCINAEKLYKIPVGLQMADIFSQHLTKKQYFKSVLLNQKESADYYVEATIKHFYGAQDFSTKAAIGAGFGLIGAIATAGLKTEGVVIVELGDIKVFDRNDNLVVELGLLKKKVEGVFPVTADCYCIYKNINQELSKFNEELAQMIWMEIQE